MKKPVPAVDLVQVGEGDHAELMTQDERGFLSRLVGSAGDAIRDAARPAWKRAPRSRLQPTEVRTDPTPARRWMRRLEKAGIEALTVCSCACRCSRLIDAKGSCAPCTRGRHAKALHRREHPVREAQRKAARAKREARVARRKAKEKARA